MRIAAVALAGLGLLAAAGCKSIGPATVPRDRFDYSAAITDSWKRQTLLNIVKLRYLDPPTFVDVGQIVAGYSLETGISAGGSFPETSAFGGNTASVGGSVKFTDRPTVTYTPLTGNRFVKGLMTPLPPDSLFFMIQAGWPADAVFVVAVASMNGLKNQHNSLSGVAPPEEQFIKALELLRRIQLSGAVGMRIVQDTNKTQSSVITFRSRNITQDTLDDIAALRRLLQLDPEAAEFKLTFGGTAANDRELSVLTRSIMQIMMTLALQIEVPPADVAEGRTSPGLPATEPALERARLLRIQSSKSRPNDAYVAVPYRGHWFWIDDRDLKSKRTFAFMMMFFTLADTGERENLPLITIPAQ